VQDLLLCFWVPTSSTQHHFFCNHLNHFENQTCSNNFVKIWKNANKSANKSQSVHAEVEGWEKSSALFLGAQKQ
jgi:hypothetical protein